MRNPTTGIRASFACATLCGLLFAAHPAQAILIEVDLFSAGDGLLTQDTDTGLEWLDLTQTLGQSFNDIAGGFGGLLTTEGFRYADNLDVIQLIASAGGDDPAGVGVLLSLLGCTINCGTDNPGAIGILPETAGLIEFSWFLMDGANSDVFVPGPDGSFPDTGHFLLRDITAVPEASTLALLAIGLLGLGLHHRRRRSKISP